MKNNNHFSGVAFHSFQTNKWRFWNVVRTPWKCSVLKPLKNVLRTILKGITLAWFHLFLTFTLNHFHKYTLNLAATNAPLILSFAQQTLKVKRWGRLPSSARAQPAAPGPSVAENAVPWCVQWGYIYDVIVLSQPSYDLLFFEDLFAGSFAKFSLNCQLLNLTEHLAVEPNTQLQLVTLEPHCGSLVATSRGLYWVALPWYCITQVTRYIRYSPDLRTGTRLTNVWEPLSWTLTNERCCSLLE